MQLTQCKLGYGGTKEEMVRLINDSGILNTKIKDLDGITFDQMIEAIHKIQEEMGITGTTAEEAAETISGSKASLVAAWNDLMMTVAGADMMDLDTAIAAFQTSFSAYMSNFLPGLMTSLANSGTLVEGIAGALSNLPDDLLSTILSAALEGGTGVVSGIDTVVNWLIDQITMSLHGSAIDTTRVAAFAGALGTFVGHTVGNVVTKLPTLVSDLFQVGVTMASEIIKGIWDGLFGNGTDNELQKIEEEFNSTLVEAETQSARAQAILSVMQGLHDKYGAAARETEEWKKREEELETILGGSKDTFDEYGENVEGAITHLKNMAEELRKLAIQQAMDERLKAEYAELGNLELSRYEAQAQQEDQQAFMNIIEQKVQGMTQGYVDELMDLLAQDSVRNKLGENNYVAYLNAAEEAQDTIKGSNGIVDLARLLSSGEFSNLTNALKNTYNLLNTPEEERIWTRGGYTDADYSPEVIEGMLDQYQIAADKLETANKAYDEATDGIDKVKERIASTERAVETIANELNGTGTDVGAAGDALAGALYALAGKVGAIKIPQFEKPAFNTRYGEWTTVTEAPKAVGMDYVPYDGFRAILHKGEAIITRQDNERRGGYDPGIMESALEAAIERSMSRMNISMNGEKVADLTTDRVNRNISGSDHSRKRAMGG